MESLAKAYIAEKYPSFIGFGEADTETFPPKRYIDKLVDAVPVNRSAIPTRFNLTSAAPLPQKYQKAKPKELVFKLASEIPMERLEWLFEGYLAKRKLSLLAGYGGIGKSSIALLWAAIVSNGATFPDGTPVVEGKVIIWSAEDTASDTIVPRLVAAGAKLENILIIRGTRDADTGEGIPFDPATDIPIIVKAMDATGFKLSIGLVIIDPIVSAVAGDSHQGNQVRRSLQPIVDLADSMNCAVLGLTHFRKDSVGQRTDERVLGSIQFVNLARCVIAASKNKSTGRCVIVPTKYNNADDSNRGYEYHIEAASLPAPDHGQPIKTSKIVWGESIEGTADEILASVEVAPEKDGDTGFRLDSKAFEAATFLKFMLHHGPKPVTEIEDIARTYAMLSKTTIVRAFKALNGIVDRQGFQGKVCWRLPQQFLIDASDIPPVQKSS